MPVPQNNFNMLQILREIFDDLCDTRNYLSAVSGYIKATNIWLRDLFDKSTLDKTQPLDMEDFAGYTHIPFVTLSGRLVEESDTSTKVEAAWQFQNPVPRTGYISWTATDNSTGQVYSMNTPFYKGAGLAYAGVVNSPEFQKKASSYTVTLSFVSSVEFQLQGVNTHTLTIPASTVTEPEPVPINTGIYITAPYQDWLDANFAPLEYRAYTLSGNFGRGEVVYYGTTSGNVIKVPENHHFRDWYDQLWTVQSGVMEYSF